MKKKEAKCIRMVALVGTLRCRAWKFVRGFVDPDNYETMILMYAYQILFPRTGAVRQMYSERIWKSEWPHRQGCARSISPNTSNIALGSKEVVSVSKKYYIISDESNPKFFSHQPKRTRLL